jgi:hypothetical protein
MDANVIGTIVGAVLAGVIGISTVFFAKNLEEKKNKILIARALLSEVQVNQEELKRLNITFQEAEKLVQREPNLYLFDFVAKKMGFDKTLYSALADKIGLLDSTSRDNLIQYYSGISKLEYWLGLLRGKEYSEFFKELAKEFATKDNSLEVYKIGEELIKSLGKQSKSLAP